jgi:methionine synthase I (cobalamin-dependent)
MQDGLVLTDGAMGTALQTCGLPLGAIPELWNLTQPEDVAGVTAAYVAAGARIVLSNTFGANRWRLREHGNHLSVLNQAGVLLARKGAARNAFVFAAIGPSGTRAGEVTTTELAEGFEEQVDAIAQAKPDGLVIETMTQLSEALIAVKAAKRTDLPVIASMTFGFGTSPEEAIPALIAAGADVVGANCGNGPAEFPALCVSIKNFAGATPVWMKPNAGFPKIENGKAHYDLSPQEFAKQALALRKAGADFIGGCCGTMADHIQAIKKALI